MALYLVLEDFAAGPFSASAGSLLSGRPVVVSCDILARQSINAGN
jgi:hypothetical protein